MERNLLKKIKHSSTIYEFPPKRIQFDTRTTNKRIDFGLVPNQKPDFGKNESSIFFFYRKGTHDLSDVGHDLRVGEYFEILCDLALEISKIHKNGYVHRDIKPGNVMINQMINGKKFAGIVDFGMALKMNRKQNEEGVVGGTQHFRHPSQLEANERARPGQDWFSYSITALYLLRGGVDSMQAEINRSINGVNLNFENLPAGPIMKFSSLLQEMVRMPLHLRSLPRRTGRMCEQTCKFRIKDK